ARGQMRELLLDHLELELRLARREAGRRVRVLALALAGPRPGGSGIARERGLEGADAGLQRDDLRVALGEDAALLHQLAAQLGEPALGRRLRRAGRAGPRLERLL